MAKNLIFILVLILINYTMSFAQMVNASLFGEMKAINPAVISDRKSGQFTLIATKVDGKKDQLVDGENQKLSVDVNDLSIFRGGKGGGFTTEFYLRTATGDVVRKAEDGDTTTNAKMNHLSYGVGLGSWGFSTFINTFSYKNTEVSGLDQSSTMIDFKWGTTGKFLGLNSGFTAEILAIKLDLDEEEEEGGGNAMDEEPPPGFMPMPLLGFGLGTKAGSTHFELAYELVPVPMSEDSGDGTGSKKTFIPMRISLTTEFKVWGIAIGYTGRAYMSGFQDAEQALNNRILFFKREDFRLEHNINFALGGSSGLSISASASLSETKGKEPLSATAPETLTYETTTKLIVLSAKLGYVW